MMAFLPLEASSPSLPCTVYTVHDVSSSVQVGHFNTQYAIHNTYYTIHNTHKHTNTSRETYKHSGSYTSTRVAAAGSLFSMYGPYLQSVEVGHFDRDAEREFLVEYVDHLKKKERRRVILF